MDDLWIIYSIKFMEDIPNPSTRMLDDAISNGLKSKLLYYELFEEKDNQIYYDNKILNELPKIILLRGNDINVSTIFEKRNIKVINSTYTINNCVDKLKTHKICDELNIKQIKTYHFKNISYDEIIKLTGLPFVLKYRFGKQGMNIFIIHNEDEYKDCLNNINLDDYIIQEFIDTSYGKDVRVFIIGDVFIKACMRVNETGFMSNLAQGGLTYPFELTKEIEEKSLLLKNKLKGDIISVDYVFGKKDELLFCEANTNPGFASFNFLGYPIRKYIMDYIKEIIKGN